MTVGDDELVVGAAIEMKLCDCVEYDDLHTRLSRGDLALFIAHEAGILCTRLKRPQFIMGGMHRTEGIHHDAHIDTALHRIAKRAQYRVANRVPSKDVIHHIQRMLGIFDQPDFRSKRGQGIIISRANDLRARLVDRDARFLAEVG